MQLGYFKPYFKPGDSPRKFRSSPKGSSRRWGAPAYRPSSSVRRPHRVVVVPWEDPSWIYSYLWCRNHVYIHVRLKTKQEPGMPLLPAQELLKSKGNEIWKSQIMEWTWRETGWINFKCYSSGQPELKTTGSLTGQFMRPARNIPSHRIDWLIGIPIDGFYWVLIIPHKLSSTILSIS